MAIYFEQDKEKLEVAVCILFFEKLAQTIECIESFLPSGVNIYVLNNGSSLSSRESLGKFCEPYKQIKIFDSNVNSGPAGGRNYLINHTHEDWLLFVDNDVSLKNKSHDIMKILQNHVLSNKDIEVFMPDMYVAHTNSYAKPYSYRIEGDFAFLDELIFNNTVNTFRGGASFINRKLFDRVGLYDDRLFALEEFELTLRAIFLGVPIRVKLIHDIELMHDHRGAIKEVDKKAAEVRYNLDTLNKCYSLIKSKYGIQLLDSAKIGTVYNLEHMVNSYNIFSIYFWKQLVPKQIKKFLKELYISKIQKRAEPRSASLYLTDRCNFNCSGCRRQHIGIDKSKDMSLSTVQRLLSLYPTVERFCIAGQGEPTLCTAFVEIVDYLKKIGKFVTIVTNGTNPSKILALSCEPDCISISLYGFNKQQYISYTGADLFENVIDSFKKLRNRFNNVGISFIVNKSNYKELDGILSLCEVLNPAFVDLHNYLAYDPDNQMEISKIIKTQDIEIIDYINSVCNGRSYLINKPIYINLEKSKLLCRSYNYVINLDGSGNIGGCQRHITPKPEFGNIFNDVDPYNSAAMAGLRKKRFKKQLIHEECAFCFGNWWNE